MGCGINFERLTWVSLYLKDIRHSTVNIDIFVMYIFLINLCFLDICENIHSEIYSHHRSKVK